MGRKKRKAIKTVITPVGDKLKFTDQSETQEEFQEEIQELESMVRVLTDFYGGKEFKVKLFRGLDVDSEERANDTDFNAIPVSLQDIKTKTRKPYRVLSRAGHRFVAPADIIQHKASLETAIRRINNRTLQFPDKLFDINPSRKDASVKRKYYLNLLTNMVWDCLIELKLPNLLPDDLKQDYLKGRESVLQKANVQNLDDSMLSRVKKLQYLFSLFIHQKQHKTSKTDSLPIDVESQLSDHLATLNNPKTSLVKKVNDMLPVYLELLQKDKNDSDNPNQNQNQNNQGNNQGNNQSFSISAVIDNLQNSGSGNEKFGATYLDYFDPTKELSVQEQAKVEKEVQSALQELGEEIASKYNEKIPSMSSENKSKGKGKQAGKGIWKINTYEESPFSKQSYKQMDYSEYSEILSDSIQRTQKHLADKKGKRERIGNTIWNTSDPTKELLLLDSIQTSGLLIPNTTTLKPIYDVGPNTDSYEYSANLIVMIDVSGSMSGKPLELAIQSALSSCMIAKEERGKISVIAFESQAWEICPPTNDIEIVKDRLASLFETGGTSISAAFHVVTNHLSDMGKANVLMITDAYISDWKDKKIQDEFSMMQDRILNFNVFQLVSRNDQLENGDFLTFLNDSFKDVNFFGMNYHEAENFTDKVLQAVNI